jgi:PAS domain S-box-containing protein
MSADAARKQRRLFLGLFLPLAGLVIAAAFLIAHSRTGAELARLRNSESTRIELGTEEIVRALKKAPAHLKSLQTETAIRRAIDSATTVNLDAMAESFATLLERNSEYDQARWIDETGMERSRVNRGDDQAGIRVASAADFQDKSDRLYFRESKDLPLDRIYVSQLDLNVDNGEVTIPYRPTIRFAVPIADDKGARRGIIVVNYLAQSLLDQFLDVTGRTDRHTELVNLDGYWLSSPNAGDQWAFMFDRPITVQTRFPAAWARIRADRSGQYIGDDGLWTWQAISLQGEWPGLGRELAGPTWIAISHEPSEVVESIYRRIWMPTLATAGITIFVFAAMSWYIAARSRRERETFESRIRAEAVVAESTERIAALEQAQKFGSMLAAIVDSSQDAIISKDLNSRITSWNAGAEHLFGYPVSEAIGQSLTMIIPAERQHEEQEIIDRVVKGEVVTHFETVRRHKDGHLIDISATISPIRDGAGSIIGASKIARDITRAKNIEEELHLYQEQLEELVEKRTRQIEEATEQLRERDKLITAVSDNVPGMVSYWDRGLRCKFANRGYLEWLGKRPEDIVGKRMAEVFPAEFIDAGKTAWDAALHGEPGHIIRERLKPNGETGHLSVHYIPDFTDGEVVGFFVLAIDITKQKQAEDELRRLNSKLTDALALAQEASKAKGQFLANMSHEIRTPMNGVIGMLELLGHTHLDPEQLRMIGTIDSSAQSLLEIINDILDFSKIEAGQLKVELIEADATEIVESTARLFLGAAASKDISIRCFSAPAVRNSFVTDPVRLRQILGNLVSNAVKFTSHGGVTITVDMMPDEIAGSKVRFVVADTGLGISPEAQARLFRPFTQGDGSVARKFGGTGLGLSICRRLTDLLGGEIRLSSTEGKGTEVALTLPSSVSRESVDVGDIDLRGVKVGMLIDDQTERHYLGAYLAYWGATVATLSSDVKSLQEWMTDPNAIILAPAASICTMRSRVEAAGVEERSPLRRYVYYSHDDLAADQHPAEDSIVTTALSRCRIVTAVAVAAGRKSPEAEMAPAFSAARTGPLAPTRDQAIAAGTLILLAEDHPVNRDVVLRQLRFLGYAADAVEDGAQALAALARTRYGLLLTDCNMPVMDGFELAHSIRQAERGDDHLPIIALTANALEGEDRQCIAAGMDDYLSKPVELKTLRQRLECWLNPAPFRAPGPAPQPAGPKATSVVDLSLLAEYCGNDPAATLETLGLYVESLAADFKKLSSAAARKDAKASELFAHRIKGAARAVGGHGLEACSETAERAANKRDWVTTQGELPRIGTAIEEIRHTLEEARASDVVREWHPAPV